MKTVRICLLLLLVLLLPVRGAAAAAMLCPPGSTGVPQEQRGHGSLPAHQAMDPDAIAHQHASVDGALEHGGQHDASSDKCNACSAFCSLTPLPGAVPTLPDPLGAAAVKFSELSAPPPNFFSDGQERPPRTR